MRVGGGFHGLGIRGRVPRDARTFNEERLPDAVLRNIPRLLASAESPWVGITTDGTAKPGLFSLEPTGIPTTPITEAANRFLAALTASQRIAATRPIDSPDWRTWHNSQMFLFRHGVLLEELEEVQREAAYDLLRSSLSAFGFESARNIMRLNDFLREITGFSESVGEHLYWLNVFGTPSDEEPWGWQIDGHHLNVSYFVVGDQVVMSPVFMGGEPVYADTGQYAGISIFEAEQRNALELIRSLSTAQRDEAILYPTMLSSELPPERAHRSEGRQKSTAFRDNAVIPYEGIAAKELTSGQQELLLSVVGAYIGYLRPGHNGLRMGEIEQQLDATHFAWIGGIGGDDTFYYKVHSPVVIIEFDMHSGVFLDNDEPEKLHIHTMLRTPNGNDYGKDLLRQSRADRPMGGRGG